MNIYISSTYTDLKEHRESILSVIPSINREIKGNFGDPYIVDIENKSSIDEIKIKLKETSIFILLLGWRYGYIPEGYENSIVEIEYDIAVENDVPILCYVIDDNYPIPPKFFELGVANTKLSKLKDRIFQQHVVRKFGSPEELSKFVSDDLIRYINTSLSKAVIDTLDRPYIENELEFMKKENSVLLNRLEIFNIKWKNLVPAEPIWKTRNFSIDTTLCFVLMPFKQIFLTIYEESILSALQNSGLRGMHAGNIFDNREIIEDIWESIATARLIIADVSERNPNVFYEMGICHTIGKEVIIITQNENDVPFDIKHRRYIKYEPDKLNLLKTTLEKTVKNILIKTK